MTMIVEINGDKAPALTFYDENGILQKYAPNDSASAFAKYSGFTTDGLLGLMMVKANPATYGEVELEIDSIGVWAGAGLNRADLLKAMQEMDNAEDPKQVVEKDKNVFADPLFALAALYAQRYEVQLFGENCSISGDTVIKYKRNGTVSITPAEGYEIVDVMADGTALGAVNEVTFKRVTKHPELVVITRAIEPIG